MIESRRKWVFKFFGFQHNGTLPVRSLVRRLSPTGTLGSALTRLLIETKAGRGLAQTCRLEPRPHCPGPACPLLCEFQSWRCRYAAIKTCFSAKYIPD